jgi:hypothetical protein
MTGRLDQARSRANGVAKRRMDNLAALVALGIPVAEAGRRLNLTAGETARTWANIRKGLGEQAV